MSLPLEGKSALVTGGAKRIGREIALSLARAGAKVAITFLSAEADARATQNELESLGVEALSLVCDVTTEASVAAAVEAATDVFHGLDILVNNAGLFETADLADIDLARWDAMFATNTRGPFLMARAAHTELKRSHGRIINIGSLGGEHAWATHGHYCASKAALHMLSQTMAKAWAPEISVNCVAPGMIVFDETGEAYERSAQRTPMQRNGTAADVAAAVLFFATAPSFITGQILTVDGGLGL